MAEGLLARFDRIDGVTAKGLLTKPLTLPAVLNNVAVDEEAAHSEYDTVSAGTFSQEALGGTTARKLRAVELEALTLSYDAAFLVSSGQDDETIEQELMQVLRSKKAVTLTLTLPWGNTGVFLRMNVTLRSVRKEMKAQEPDARYFTVSIREWRDAKVGRRSSHSKGRKTGVTLPTTHKLTAADTLESLAKDFYGRYDEWRTIRDANGISKKFGQSTPLVKLGRYKKGSTIKIPLAGVAQTTGGTEARAA